MLYAYPTAPTKLCRLKFAHFLFRVIYIHSSVVSSLHTTVFTLSRALACKLFLFFRVVASARGKNKMCLQIALAFLAIMIELFKYYFSVITFTAVV